MALYVCGTFSFDRTDDMTGVYNVRNPPPVAEGMPPRPVAHGDGCHDDTPAIKAGLAALLRSGSSPEDCAKDNTLKSWPDYVAELYFPAGIYRITEPLEIPFSQHFRIFGDGERGGELDDIVPTGTMIRQDKAGQPIFVFKSKDTHSWAIEKLGFSWLKPQTPPAGWSPAPDNATQIAPGVTEPGAVAILFSGRQGSAQTDYYHGRISNCHFQGGWRGISFDDSLVSGQVSLWNTRMEGLNMIDVLGAGLSLVVASGGIGMPVNSFRNSFMDNPRVPNVEPRIQIAQQGAFLMENVTLERSRTQVLSCVDCSMTMRNVSVEHAQIKKPLGIMIYFGGGQYAVETFGFDGWMDSKTPQGNQGFSTIINADGTYPNPDDERAFGNPTTVVLSNVQAAPLLPSAVDPEAGGFAPLNGPVVLLGGATNTEYVVLNTPKLPVFPGARRRAEWDLRLTGGQGSPTYEEVYGRYRELLTFSNELSQVMSSVVKMPEIKKTTPVDIGTIAAGTVKTVSVSLVTSPSGKPAPGQPRARPGDMVRLGPPGTLPAGLVVTGFVSTDDSVNVRVYNATRAAVTVPYAPADPTTWWTIEVSGGPLSGAEQFIPDQPLLAEPLPS